MARELTDIVKDLQAAITDVAHKNEVKYNTEEAYKKASLEHQKAQDTATTLKAELEAVFNMFIPAGAQGRVRSSQ